MMTQEDNNRLLNPLEQRDKDDYYLW